MKAVLTIAGSDSSGGAGVQADLKTIEAYGLYGESAITALTAQNTTGVYGILPVEPNFIAKQIDVVFNDIRPDAVKIGMIGSGAGGQAMAEALRRHGMIHVVVDPVLVSTSGSSLANDDVVEALWHYVFPLAEVITPNLHEAEVLAGMTITSEAEIEEAASRIAERCIVEGAAPTILIKGGHGVGAYGESNDYMRQPWGAGEWLRGPRDDNPNTHGTGCTLSSAIACNLALGLSVTEAIEEAKAYVYGAIAAGLDLGRGSGPLHHRYRTQPLT